MCRKVFVAAGLELDTLYRSILDGPTPEIPEEDEREREWLQAETHFNTMGILLNTEKQTYDILVDADKFLTLAIQDIISDRNASGYDC